MADTATPLFDPQPGDRVTAVWSGEEFTGHLVRISALLAQDGTKIGVRDEDGGLLHIVSKATARPVAEPVHLHTLTTGCWCDPESALDGHVNEDGSAPEFAATDQDPVDADGYLIEVLAR